MKKAKYVFFAILFAIYIISQTTNPLVMGYVYAKHISLFLMIGIMVYYITNYISDQTISRLNLVGTKETLTLVLKIIVFTGTLVLTSILQLGYIEYSDTPYVTGCKYYDMYGNEIYVSKTKNECASLKIIENSNTTLAFEVEETQNDVVLDSFKFDTEETTQYDNVYITTNYLTKTFIQYDSNHRISSVLLNASSINVIKAENRQESEYRSSSIITNNSYENEYVQIIKIASMIEPYNEDMTDNITHASFNDDEYQTITYYTEETPSGLERTLYKEYVLEGELVIDEIMIVSNSQAAENKIFNLFDISNNLSNIQHDTELSIFDDSITVIDHLDGDYSDTLITSIYLEDDKYGYLIQSKNAIVEENDTVRNNQTTYTLTEVDEKDYVISHFTSDMDFNFTIEDDLYELEETTFGMIVHYLDYHNDSYFSYLRRRDVHESSIFFYYQLGIESTSIFETNYSIKYAFIDDIIYKEADYLSID